jgi:ribosomal protein S18 acetylase RimI-like enzyme
MGTQLQSGQREEAKIEVLTDLTEAIGVLAAAFSVEKAVREVFKMDQQHLRMLYRIWVPTLLKNLGSIVFGIRDGKGLAGVAVCQGPGPEPPFWKMTVNGLPMLWRLGLRRCLLLSRLDSDFRLHSPLRPAHIRLAILGTRPDAFHRGYGSALLKRVSEHTLSCGFTKVYLEADSEGRPKRLYQKHGYKTVDQFKSVAGPIDIMVKNL